MGKIRFNLFFSFFLFFAVNIFASSNVQLIKKENTDSNTTLLVIGGIHGNEPGGYFAASILATQYKITSKNLWIVPNLNQESIQSDNRGVNGDMNRKFASIGKDDKDSKIVQDIKKVILSKKVSLVLNLHDGHGFYRKKHQGSIFNPNSWGQTCVIDQYKLKQEQPFGDLNSIASAVKNNINKKLLTDLHSFDVKNTNTEFKDEAMQLSLTYFAVTNNKPAFAIESSKNLSSLSKKVFYQLLAIEEFMKIMGITFKREFELNEKELDKILKKYGILKINNNISLNLNNIRKSLSYIPIELSENVFEFSHPLGSVKKIHGNFVVYIGNKIITLLEPQYFKVAKNCEEKIDIRIDNQMKSIKLPSSFSVNDDFNIVKSSNFRVNVIGFKSKKHSTECGVDINQEAMDNKFSVDKNHNEYRIEFYKDDKFCSMSMVYFK
ncbi:MAG: hypothetical protein ACJAWW_002846 [Sulfurimonas sp.]|jgi:hypothetical protein